MGWLVTILLSDRPQTEAGCNLSVELRVNDRRVSSARPSSEPGAQGAGGRRPRVKGSHLPGHDGRPGQRRGSRRSLWLCPVGLNDGYGGPDEAC